MKYAIKTAQTNCQTIVADNPLDVATIAERIVKTQNTVLRSLPQNVPLVILVPICYKTPIDTALVIALLKKLKAQDSDCNFAFGTDKIKNYRSWHDALLKPSLDTRFFRYVSQKLRGNPKELGDVEIYLKDGFPSEAEKRLFAHTLNTNVPTAFNGIAWEWDKNRDQVFRQGDWTVKSGSSDGHALENKTIVNNALEHMKRTEARVYIQTVAVPASDFLFSLGVDRSEEAQEKSLYEQFRQAGCAVMPLWIEEDERDQKFYGYDNGHDISMRIEGMDRTTSKNFGAIGNIVFGGSSTRQRRHLDAIDRASSEAFKIPTCEAT